MGQGSFSWDEAPANAASLASADPAHWPVAPDWQPSTSAFWASSAGMGVLKHLRQRLAQGAVIYPPQPMKALALTSLAGVRVVILGQDPYHGPGQAEGLAFSVPPGVKLPPSLRNIFKELKRDLDLPTPKSGSLVRWAEQGVLLLNASLTVEAQQPGSHAKIGWEVLTDRLVRLCSEATGPKVFLLWGAHAQKKRALIDAQRHKVLCANHPSPLSASRGAVPFLGCGHFGATNAWLAERGLQPIRW